MKCKLSSSFINASTWFGVNLLYYVCDEKCNKVISSVICVLNFKQHELIKFLMRKIID